MQSAAQKAPNRSTVKVGAKSGSWHRVEAQIGRQKLQGPIWLQACRNRTLRA